MVEDKEKVIERVVGFLYNALDNFKDTIDDVTSSLNTLMDSLQKVRADLQNLGISAPERSGMDAGVLRSTLRASKDVDSRSRLISLLTGQKVEPQLTVVAAAPTAPKPTPGPMAGPPKPMGGPPKPMGGPPKPMGGPPKPMGGPPKPIADGRTSKADGRTSKADGRTSKADGRTSKADGRTSKADGGTPKTRGWTSKTDGGTSKTRGRTFKNASLCGTSDGKTSYGCISLDCGFCT